MSNVGIEFTLKNGDKDWYDPVNLDTDFEETENLYIISMYYNKYKIEKSLVKSIRYYDLCDNCGRELINNICTYCE